MKQSKFNYIKSYDDGTMLIYNTMSAGVLYLDLEHTERFKKAEAAGFTGDEKLCAGLKRGHILIDDDYDEMGFLNLSGKMSKFSPLSLSLTIAPTMDCNFRCPYCYEKGVKYETMSQEVQNKLVDFINDQADHIKSLGIAWYGGEPLLEFDIIESLSKRILEICEQKQVEYDACMVTNGYLLSEDYAKRMKEIKVSMVQITIDGDAEQHNKRRIHHKGIPTYNVIMDNLEKACLYTQISIRMNIDKKNFSSVDLFLDDITERGLNNKVNIYMAPVDNINDTYTNSQCFTISQFSDIEIDFYNKLIDKGMVRLSMPSASFGYCGAVSSNSFVVDPQGTLYKCWNEIGHKESSIGSLGMGVNNSFLNNSWLLYDAFEDDECKECKMLPVCFGGCAHSAIYKNGHKCKSTKYNAEKMLDLLVKLKRSNVRKERLVNVQG